MQDKSKFTWGRKTSELLPEKEDLATWESEKAVVIKKIKSGTDIDDDTWGKMKNICMSIAKGRDSQDFSAFHHAEYKYFSELTNLYRQYESKAVTKESAESTEKKLFKEYQDFKEQETKWWDGIVRWNDAIRVTEMCRSSMNKCDDKDVAFELALQAISKMTGDVTVMSVTRKKYFGDKPLAVTYDVSPTYYKKTIEEQAEKGNA